MHSAAEVSQLLSEQRMDLMDESIRSNYADLMVVMKQGNEHYSELKDMIKDLNLNRVKDIHEMKAYAHDNFVSTKMLDDKMKIIRYSIPVIVLSALASLGSFIVIWNKLNGH